MMSNLVLRKLCLRISKVPSSGHWYSKLPLVRLVHLIKNAHEEKLQFLDIKLAKVSVVEMPSKYLDNLDLISQIFFLLE